MKKEMIAISWRVELAIYQMQTVLDRDGEEILEEDGKTLHDRLVKLEYVDKVDYDGMFGAYIYIDLYPPTTEEQWDEIEEIIRDYIKLEPFLKIGEE